LAAAIDAIKNAAKNLGAKPDDAIDLSALADRYQQRLESIELYTDAYRRYCWDVGGIDDYRIAPFHILATEGRAWNDTNNIAHMETIAKYIAGSDPIFMATEYMPINLLDENSIESEPVDPRL
jgi:protein phosphatase